MNSFVIRTVVILVALLAFGAEARAQEYRVEAFEAAAPAELAPAIREALSGGALRVIGPEGPLCEIWLRAAVPARATAQQRLGIAYGQFEEGTLFGAVRFLLENRDYRKQRVKPGVYTLRYALNLVDGNHMGVAPNRDFLLLLPAAEDVNTANVIKADAVALSRKAIQLNHPSVWSLTTGESDQVKTPGMAHQEEEDVWVLYFRVQVQPAGGTPAPLLMGLVVSGHAPEA